MNTSFQFGEYFVSSDSMAEMHSLLVGIEEFFDQKIPKVGCAKRDAEDLATALLEVGYQKEAQEILVNGAATANNVRFSIRQILKCAREDDTVLIFFSSHGYSDGSKTYLVCHDSRFGDYTGTSIPLTEILELFNESKCKKVLLLLDCCHAGLNFPGGQKSILTDMSLDQVKEFFNDSEYRAAFASCKDSEKSFWAETLGHGVWTHALLEALSGAEKKILENNRFLRAGGLQDYLKKRVPELLRECFEDKTRVQSPRFFGSVSNDFLVADLGPLLRKNAAANGPADFPIKETTFRHIEKGSVTNLSGFDKKKGHKVYSEVTTATEEFVEKIGSSDVERKAKEIFEQVKEAFGYIRKQIRIDFDGATATIQAQDFDVNVFLRQNSSDPSEYILTTEVSNFANGSVVMTDQFNEAFDGVISRLRISFSKKRSVVEFIDKIEEERENTPITIDHYPDDNSYCRFRIEGVPATFTLREKSLEVKLSGEPPREMIKCFLDGGKALLAQENSIKLLS